MQCEICYFLNTHGKGMEHAVLDQIYWKTFLAEKQDLLGRCVIVLKRHCGDLARITHQEMVEFITCADILQNALRKAFDATMFNWACLMNNAYQTEHPNPHVHWHLRPRYDHSVHFKGHMFQDVHFGHHYRLDNRKVPLEIRQKIMERIKECL